MVKSKYDIIGDVHGHAMTLQALLTRLGYVCTNGTWRHPDRTAIFMGDFIDRGPYQKEVLGIVRPMIDSGAALAVMGNHEFNAIAYFTRSPAGGYLRAHSDKNTRQHRAFLDTYELDPEAWAETIEWFKTLPLWLDLDDLRIIHACWDDVQIARLTDYLKGEPKLSEHLLIESSKKGTWQYTALDILLKGKEISLSNGQTFTDEAGNVRHDIRVRWWDKTATTYRKAFLGPESSVTHIPDDPIAGDHLIEYSHDMTPVFVGHYWLDGTPTPLADNIVCVDYGVPLSGGKLVAYRWNGEKTLSGEGFVSVTNVDSK